MRGVPTGIRPNPDPRELNRKLGAQEIESLRFSVRQNFSIKKIKSGDA